MTPAFLAAITTGTLLLSLPDIWAKALQGRHGRILERTGEEAIGLTLDAARLRSKYAVTVVGVKRSGEEFTYATADTAVHADDLLIAAGPTDACQRFGAVT